MVNKIESNIYIKQEKFRLFEVEKFLFKTQKTGHLECQIGIYYVWNWINCKSDQWYTQITLLDRNRLKEKRNTVTEKNCTNAVLIK